MEDENVESDREEERKIQSLLELIHTLSQLSELHSKELNNLSLNDNTSEEDKRIKLQQEAIAASTIAKISGKILRSFASYLNNHHT